MIRKPAGSKIHEWPLPSLLPVPSFREYRRLRREYIRILKRERADIAEYQRLGIRIADSDRRHLGLMREAMTLRAQTGIEDPQVLEIAERITGQKAASIQEQGIVAERLGTVEREKAEALVDLAFAFEAYLDSRRTLLNILIIVSFGLCVLAVELQNSEFKGMFSAWPLRVAIYTSLASAYWIWRSRIPHEAADDNCHEVSIDGKDLSEGAIKHAIDRTERFRSDLQAQSRVYLGTGSVVGVLGIAVLLLTFPLFPEPKVLAYGPFVFIELFALFQLRLHARATKSARSLQVVDRLLIGLLIKYRLCRETGDLSSFLTFSADTICREDRSSDEGPESVLPAEVLRLLTKVVEAARPAKSKPEATSVPAEADRDEKKS